MRLRPMIFAAVAGLGVGIAGAQAALAPQYDRLKQFQTVLSSGVVEAFGGRVIDKVIRNEDGMFEVWAGECVVMVTLTSILPRQGMVGPTTYEVASISRLACK